MGDEKRSWVSGGDVTGVVPGGEAPIGKGPLLLGGVGQGGGSGQALTTPSEETVSGQPWARGFWQQRPAREDELAAALGVGAGRLG